MSIKVALEHRTTYRFDRPIDIGPHVIRLRPAPHTRTPIEAYSLSISPANHFINWQQDPFGNYLARVVFPEKADELDITVGLVADLEVINPFDFFVEEYAETYPFSYASALRADLEAYLAPVEDSPGLGLGPVLTGWLDALPIGKPGPDGQVPAVPIVDFLVALNAAVYGDVGYSVRMEQGVQSPDETLTRAIGSCRDSAWLLVAALRHYGLAARFVSGYLVQLTSDTEPLEGPGGPKEDFTDLHAWAEVFVPGAGWIGLDPTSALFAGEGHIPLAATPHPSNASPISGATEPTEVEFAFHNTVTRFHEDPRVTKPYTPAQVAHLQEVGVSVDKILADLGLDLTMGGEPTFVSIDDMTSPQWTVAADGPEKRALANDLAVRLFADFAPGGLIQRSQGKWYPGEPLPRWQIGLIWRTDGEPLWTDPALLADPFDPSTADENAASAAEQIARLVTARFGLPDEALQACFEDPFAALAGEVGKPEGAPPAPERRPARHRSGPGVRARRRPLHPGRLGAATHPGLVGQRLGQCPLAVPSRSAGAAARRLPGRRADAAVLGELEGPGVRGRGGLHVLRCRARGRDPRGRRRRPRRDPLADRAGGAGPGRHRAPLPAAAGEAGEVRRADRPARRGRP